jgi:hypothetical protein
VPETDAAETGTSIGTSSEGDTTKNADSSSTSPLSSTSDSSTSTTTSAVTMATDDSSTTSGPDESDDGSPDETDDEGTTDPCSVSFADDFEGDALDPQWWSEVEPALDLEVTGGHLVFTFSQDPSWGSLWTSETFVLSDFEVLLEVEHFTTQPEGVEINLGLSNDVGRIRIAACCGSVYAQEVIDDEIVTLGSAPWDDQRYWRVRVEGGLVHYEVSHDGVQWATLATEAASFDLSSLAIFIAGGTWAATTNPGFASIEAVELCSWP